MQQGPQILSHPRAHLQRYLPAELAPKNSEKMSLKNKNKLCEHCGHFLGGSTEDYSGVPIVGKRIKRWVKKVKKVSKGEFFMGKKYICSITMDKEEENDFYVFLENQKTFKSRFR
jgi:hypothetical protein